MRDKQVCNNRVKQCEKDWLAGSIARFVRDFSKKHPTNVRQVFDKNTKEQFPRALGSGSILSRRRPEYTLIKLQTLIYNYYD